MQKPAGRWFALLTLLSASLAALAADLDSLRADRAAIERVYYNHRLGEKPPFEQVLPPATLENLVRQDLRKETVLKKSYGLEVTPALLDAEVLRINTTTRAPEILAEIKTALGNDPVRFARAMAKPILVERLLREKFDNDDALHAAQRRRVEKVRAELLAAKPPSNGGESVPAGKSESRNPKSENVVSNLVALLKGAAPTEFTETTWQLTARPEQTNARDTNEIEIKKRFGANAKILSSPHAADGKERKFYSLTCPPNCRTCCVSSCARRAM